MTKYILLKGANPNAKILGLGVPCIFCPRLDDDSLELLLEKTKDINLKITTTNINCLLFFLETS